MRLVCPNCDAEYEVDNAAIPLAGRDVQCSNCGHGWFQTHPEAETADEAAAFASTSASMRANIRSRVAPDPEAVLSAAEDEDAAAGPAVQSAPMAQALAAARAGSVAAEGAVADPVAAEVVADSVPAQAVTAEGVPPAPRNIDESVLAVLREEAAREAAARRAETPPALETQTEMPLEPASNRRAAAGRSEPVRAAVQVADLTDTAVKEPAAVRSRGDRLPAIDEINSTLRATSDRSRDPDDAAMASLEPRVRAKAGFGRGFLLVILLGVIFLALYVFAPLIGAKVPALAGATEAYIAAINVARIWLDTQLRTLIGFLHSFNGAQSG